ncbi:MAG: exodeoxyribonuclease VII small subunit [Angelakisella sp.]|jgi:exodeoxyribonuclease VII small subunit|nr:exodeoxyribonuclease VII small subunit [Angelakisella sp.]
MEEKQTIEQSLRRLEEIVERLGEDTVSLDDSLTLFSEGMKLSQQCMKQLDEAELIVEEHSVS